MNLKVANLVAVQFGVFIGIMSWLAYAHLPFAGTRAATKTQESAANVAPASKPGDQLSQPVDYRADREEAQAVVEQPAPAMYEYSAAAVKHYSALAAKQYYEQIAPRRYASSGVENRSIVADAPSYAQVEQAPAPAPAPAVVPDYPAPEPIAYVQPAQFIVYPQPQFVVFSNRHRFANRCRPAPSVIGAHIATTRRHSDRPRAHLTGPTDSRPPRSFGVVHRRNDSAPPCQPTQGFRSHGKR